MGLLRDVFDRSKDGFGRIEIGNKYLDDQFIVQGNDATNIRQLLADPVQMQLIDKQPRIHLEIKDDEGLFGAAFPERVDELAFLAVGVMKTLHHSKSLFYLFARLMERLVRIDSAYEDDPGIRLSM